MTRTNQVICLMAALATGAAFTQTASAQSDQTASTSSTSTVAYIYISTNPTGNASQVNAYAAAANGKLTSIPGSPFKNDVQSMAVNGKYLFGAGSNGTDIFSYTIGANGALKYAATTDAAKYNPSGCGGVGPLIFDHTGASLYNASTVGGNCDSTAYQSFTVQKSTGGLTFLGNTTDVFLYNTPLSFLADNLFAYGSDCINYQGGYLDTFTGYRRESNGLLVLANVSAPTPKPKNGSDTYCRSLTAGDRTNHLAVSLQEIGAGNSTPVGPVVLATYTAATNGNLTTTSTYANMPATAAGTPSVLAMSPSGKLLAVGGDGGVQVFHYNGSSPITHYTGLLTTASINQVISTKGLMFWDNSNHLYAISPAAGKLFVFTVTPTSVSQAPGSPYTIAKPQTMIVQPTTPKP